MFARRHLIACAAVAALVAGTIPALADDTKIALVPGGPHPYFAAWDQAGKDAAKDFKLGAADYKVPQKWELSAQNELLESLVTQGYNAFLIFPGDPVGSVSTANELADTGAPVIATAGCLKDLTLQTLRSCLVLARGRFAGEFERFAGELPRLILTAPG